MPTDQFKIDTTAQVAQYEAWSAADRVAWGPRIDADMEAASSTPWDDTSYGLWGPGWDSFGNLSRRVAEARQSALVATGRTSTGATVTRQPAPTTTAGGFARDTASAVGDELGRLRDKVGAPTLGVVAAVVLLALFLRVRG